MILKLKFTDSSPGPVGSASRQKMISCEHHPHGASPSLGITLAEHHWASRSRAAEAGCVEVAKAEAGTETTLAM